LIVTEEFMVWSDLYKLFKRIQY